MINLMPIATKAARTIVDDLPSGVRLDMATHHRINPDYIDALAEMFQFTIASVIASIIDAGSERDAVMEDDALNLALANTLKEW